MRHTIKDSIDEIKRFNAHKDKMRMKQKCDQLARTISNTIDIYLIKEDWIYHKSKELMEDPNLFEDMYNDYGDEK